MKTNISRTVFTMLTCLVFALATFAGASESPKKVAASGKQERALEDLPPEVLATALAKRPDLDVTEAEYETRNGKEYYDVGGVLPDGSEIELDMTRVDGVWTVVEVQRDIVLAETPIAVKAVLESERPDFTVQRIIESDQGDGLIIYEFFGSGPRGKQAKIEISLENEVAELLTDEWVH